ncbi:mevalonate kinase [Salibacter sp.]|uniref:mevalonate kinase family protein n=1 Tax=Salibacter sp. TaxID=2010995 RepID=UPI002870AAD8|nr:mevalonate kinase [Salibacter sp.]MDR9398785.1 mevalonate kinase [Salibacter sp.]MDR9487875.1 mevalonate kinase [Salibacter sp.]
MIKEALFYSKILLFGEYGIIQDSMGLSIPYKAFRGELKFSSENFEAKEKSQKALNEYATHLQNLVNEPGFHAKIDVKALKNDIEKGMYFDSTIPQGFGVGSSGAIVAAIYDKYATNKFGQSKEEIGKNEIVELKEIFGKMESFFHGKSSGIDPLICYLKLPILIKGKSDLGTVGIPASNDSSAEEGAIFLLNSGTPGETQPMVNIFMEKMKQEGFRNMIKSQFKKYNDECINAFLKGDTKPLFKNLKNLSGLILDNFKPMIPKTFHKIWKQGLESNAYYLKLCGSGGGGFVLGFTQDLEKAKSLLKNHELEVIYKF